MNILFFKALLIFQTSIYNLQFTTIDGTSVSLDSFRGKKIMIVNTASSSSYASQFASLETLYQKYKDSLVVIAFPSNDFNHENLSSQDIKNMMDSTYGIHYILADKTFVSGDSICPVFQWLTSSAQNGMVDNPVSDDFFKYLVDGNGNIIGIFSGSIDPMDDSIQNAITN